MYLQTECFGVSFLIWVDNCAELIILNPFYILTHSRLGDILMFEIFHNSLVGDEDYGDEYYGIWKNISVEVCSIVLTEKNMTCTLTTPIILYDCAFSYFFSFVYLDLFLYYSRKYHNAKCFSQNTFLNFNTRKCT